MTARRVYLSAVAVLACGCAWLSAWAAVNIALPYEAAIALTWACLGSAVVAAFAVAGMVVTEG